MCLKKLILLFCLGLPSLRTSCAKSIDEKNFRTELVQVLFRHGARTPVACEADFLGSNKTLYEPWGMAQLTSQGMMQEYQIGEMLRKRYNGFLTNSYKPEYVYAYASGTSRTKASLELVLASLFPPTNEHLWNRDLRWLPVPILSNPKPMDILIKSSECPKYQQALRNLLNSTEIKQTVAKYDEIFTLLEKYYGVKYSISDIFCIYNAIFIHKDLNLPLPSWYEDKIFGKITEAIKFYFDALSHTTTLKKLNGGTLVRRFVENIKSSELEPLQGRKVYLYSAHDKNLDAFVRSHNLSLPQLPDYGSAVILEKLRADNDKLYVRMLSWSGEPKTLKTLKLENCSEICELEKYINLVSPVIPSDEDMMCLFDNLHPKDIERIFNTIY